MRRREKWIFEEYLDNDQGKISTAKLRFEVLEHQNDKMAYFAHERKEYVKQMKVKKKFNRENSALKKGNKKHEWGKL